MKKLFFALAIFASLQAFDAQAQKSPAAVKAAVEKAAAATENPKQNAKVATWVKYGQALLDAYNNPTANLWVGMSAQELAMIGGNEKPSSEEVVVVGGRQMTKQTYANKVLYFNEKGQLEIIQVTEPIVENALETALEAYKKAYELDVKGQKKKDITTALQLINSKYAEDAYSKYSLGNVAEASDLFVKAFEAAATEPFAQVDTNSIYNAAYTSWMNSDLDAAEKYFLKSVDLGYAGNEGDAYAKLADIADKKGDKAKSKGYLEKGFTLYPQSQGILVGLINYYMTSGEDSNRLFVLLDNAKKNEPNNASLYYVEGNINKQLGNKEAAVAAYRKCAEINPDYLYGYIGEGVFWYDDAVDIQDKASLETDDAKYMALMGEFEKSLKNCIAPFETVFEKTNDPEIKVSVAEYLKNACFRFRTEGAEMQAKYDKYAAAVAGN